MPDKERDEHVSPCPRCGEDAQWVFLDTQKHRVQVRCPDCGTFEMSREEFDEVATDSAEVKTSEE